MDLADMVMEWTDAAVMGIRQLEAVVMAAALDSDLAVLR